MKKLDLTGQRFGRLVAIKPAEIQKHRNTYWLCRCDCGNEKEVYIGSLKRGTTQSCGCLHREQISQLSKSLKSYNEYEVVGNTVYVKMIHGHTMICDLDDWERLKDIKWSRNSGGYASGANAENKIVIFHKQVMGENGEYIVDHINRNRLDNRKCNLRFATYAQNTWNKGMVKTNTSGAVGVYKHGKKWQVRITVNHKKMHLGAYETFEEAVKVRKEAEAKYHYFNKSKEEMNNE